MVLPFTPSPMGGFLGVTTGSLYALDPTGTVPLIPLADLLPSFKADRAVFDMIDAEQWDQVYTVTSEPLQDFSDASTNNYRELETWSLTARFTSTMLLPAGVPIPALGGLPGVGVPGFRYDLIRAKLLERLAAKREPVLAVTPERAMPRAFITSLSRPWTPDQGDVTLVNVTLQEARIVSPLDVGAVTDVEALAAGNTSVSAGGMVAGESVSPPGGTPPVSTGVGPTFG